MSDIDILRQRIEQAELRLKTAHSARQRESAALASMWDQIRDRFAAQSTEIVRLRERIAILEDTRDELHGLVRTLLTSVEGSIERMVDETVPRITGLAEDLLDSAPSSLSPQIREETIPSATPTAPSPPAQVAEPAAAESDDFAEMLAAHLDDEDGVPSLPPAPGETEPAEESVPVSPGIRTLISRIERSFDRREDAAASEPSQGAKPAADDAELDRDLDDIRRLRDELQSLRSRIGAGR